MDAQSDDHAIGERFKTLANRGLSDPLLKGKYGYIFQEQANNNEDFAFDFVEILMFIPIGRSFFVRMFKMLDNLPPLHGTDINVYGDVYQLMAHNFCGSPVLFERAGVKADKAIEPQKNLIKRFSSIY